MQHAKLLLRNGTTARPYNLYKSNMIKNVDQNT